MTIPALIPAVSFIGSAQVTTSTGTIQGTVTDPAGAVVPNAKVTLTEPSTGLTKVITTSGAGLYSTGSLIPGNYAIKVEAPGFSPTEKNIVVTVGNIAGGDIQLSVSATATQVEVEASSVQVNLDQTMVQGVLNAQQIQQLPINGRNFLDLAQLEPGVQIQDGQNFDPTKAGYSSISFGGRFGRTARIMVDGVDISDETVGTTTTDIPSSAIQEFQIAQSNLDIATELTSSGTVNVTTKSGTNQVHGQAFDYFRDYSLGAALPHPAGFSAPYYQRSQFGGNLGGPIWKDKVFLFGDGERTKQDSASPVVFDNPFTFSSGSFTSPFREGVGLGRLDSNMGKGVHAFYRYNLYHSATDATFGQGFQRYTSKNNTFQHTVGVDFTNGNFSHNIRFSYLKFENQIVDSVRGSSLPFANQPVSVDIGTLYEGTNFLAPQATPQSDKVIKYDGSWLKHNNILRYGFSYNNNRAGGFAGFYAQNPTVVTQAGASEIAAALNGPFPALYPGDPAGKADNPLNYPAERVFIASPGFSTEKPAFGFAGGLLGPDNRIGIYLEDSVKPASNITFEVGVRYIRDTGRTDSDLPADAGINAVFPGQGNRVHQPNLNFAPQVGMVWDPFKTGKTVIRAGGGLYYENVIYNNILFDRPLRLQKGAFLNVQLACNNSTAQTISTAKAGPIAPPAGVCGGPIGTVGSQLAAFESKFQAANPPNPNAVNGGSADSNLASGLNVGTAPNPSGLFAPNYKTPRSLQANIGIQRELRPGLVLSVDYLRNVETHSLLGIDINHAGDVRYFDKAAALADIQATLQQCGVQTIDEAIVSCPGIEGPGVGATISDFASNGLTSSSEFGGAGGAFTGINPSIGSFYQSQPIGRSVYNGLDVKLVGQIAHPAPGLKAINTQISYSFSRFVNTGGFNAGDSTQNSDQDFVISAVDNRNPLKYNGPSLLDRTHQFSMGLVGDIPWGFRIAGTAHLYSGLAQSLNLQSTGAPGEIFRTDVTGDGTGQDLLPGTKIGGFDRNGLNAGNLNQTINSFNSTYANHATPAGQVLINNGLFTLRQLQTLGGVVQPIANAPAGQVNMDPLRDLDMRFSWSRTVERFTIEPTVGFYNILNFANFDLPGPTAMRGVLQNAGSVVPTGYVNSTTYAQRLSDRVGTGTGVFALASPRAVEFSLNLSF
ncbi:MAG TPA: carboxypeptidase regulatory-like domain-containing protein [Acidobacteriaceae bacterium]|nr:carboxypeptidase regulatory-like domain-containing protein [Acidobacteriaceae bacterium]